MSQAHDAARVLLVEDAPDQRVIITGALRAAGFDVTEAADGESGLQAAIAEDPDVVVLDLGLPGLDGLEVCRRLREVSGAYILMLTSRGEEADTVDGLTMGADDYVVKPSSPAVLEARIRALLRRPGRKGSKRSQGALVLDAAARTVTLDGRSVDLTRIEFDLLEVLMRQPEAVVSRTDLLTAVWGPQWSADTHLLEVHISKLRQKLGDGSLIRTVRGIGYALSELS